MNDFCAKNLDLIANELVAMIDEPITLLIKSWLTLKSINHCTNIVILIEHNLYQSHRYDCKRIPYQSDFALSENANLINYKWQRLLFLWIHLNQVRSEYFTKPLEKLPVIDSIFLI